MQGSLYSLIPYFSCLFKFFHSPFSSVVVLLVCSLVDPALSNFAFVKLLIEVRKKDDL